jgi:arabinose-5-phosphate isomerase
VVAITGEAKSTLARHADIRLDGWVREEACPHDLAPTTSTTVALALGDALAVALLEVKGFQREDFARLHPGGSLGRKLLVRVSDVMISDPLPLLAPTATMREAIIELAEKRGIAVVADAGRTVLGVVTTGDLTRLMERDADLMAIPVADVMSRTPRTAAPDELGSAVGYRMETHRVIAMPVVDDRQQLVGIVHLHDLMRAGAI